MPKNSIYKSIGSFADMRRAAGDASKESPNRITRDAFLFLTPKSEAQKEDFAQCGPCRMFVPEANLQGKFNGDRCIIHGSHVDLDDDDSCGFMLPWPTPNGKPVEQVVKDHAAELLKIIPGSVTAKESGLVSRRVQCHRCFFAIEGATVCNLYRMLNTTFPEYFNLDEKVTPNSCCNAQELK